MSDELKPCPFCGGEAHIVTAVGESWVLCDKCKATTEAHTSKQFAIGAWNRRVVEYRKPTNMGELERENAKLRELVRCLVYATSPLDRATLIANAAELGPVITGDTSDGYHTFNELYHHRAVLFSVIVRNHANLAWKSRVHHDGTMYDGMFIVGIETPQGQATYHYDIDPYWDMFECKELDRAPEWDGHTPDEAIARIATLDDADATRERQDGADERDQLKAENAKLRELVLCLLTCASDVIDCDKCPINGGPGVWDFEDFCDGLLDRVHEMRIEVGDGR